ncbi:MAG: 16S rRNA (guanine(966)-N(2))-methyltransferase RsmD [Oscillospiraceae bacterium]|jgi:16S rRNA (guanine966-N2)-methyltransferase|nr:16S rRNA (guanine(966)-N(2))-methyltransferase RsmD [Oscillospiraceae bacterium]
MIRIIGGQCKGRAIDTLDGDATRPTRAIVREALFGILTPYIAGSRVLDLFAGSGALGLEALSRGADEVWLVDSNPRAVKIIEKNAAALGLSDRAHVMGCSYEIAVTGMVTSGKLFDIILLDPPYKMENQGNILSAAAKLASRDAVLVLERAKNIPICGGDSTWTLARERGYGDTVLSVYRLNSCEDTR